MVKTANRCTNTRVFAWIVLQIRTFSKRIFRCYLYPDCASDLISVKQERHHANALWSSLFIPDNFLVTEDDPILVEWSNKQPKSYFLVRKWIKVG